MNINVGILGQNTTGLIHEDTNIQTDHVIVTPGEVISVESGYLRGHGTYQDEAQNSTNLISSVAGVVERVNKLISVRPLKSRYTGEIGDIIVGRVVEVGAKRWKVDVNAAQHAVLMLSSINLPDGTQRRRTYEDSLQMRNFYEENDLISAEVQNFYADGAVALHTRSLKYGKLENGRMMEVPSVLIKRLKQHFVSLPVGVDVILGNNGYIWITCASDQSVFDDKSRLTAEIAEAARKKHAATVISIDSRERICRVSNAIAALSSQFIAISPETIMDVYTASIDLDLESRSMTNPDVVSRITSGAKEREGTLKSGYNGATLLSEMDTHTL